MSWFLLVPLLTAVLDPAARPNVWLVERPGWEREQAELLEALRIYTGDLKIALTLAPDDGGRGAAGGQPAEVGAACSATVPIVVTFAGDPKEGELRILDCATSRIDRVAWRLQPGSEPMAQVAALKVRALLARDAKDAAAPAAPGDGEGGTALGSGARPLSAPGAPGPSRPPAAGSGSASDMAIRSDGGLGARRRGELGVGYLVAVTGAGLRQGVALRLGIAWWPRPWAIELDGAWTSSTRHAGAGASATLGDVPVGLAVSARWRRDRWLVSGGPRMSLHLLRAEGVSGDGRTGRGSELALGMGAVERLRYAVSGQLDIELVLTNELLLPRRRFTVGGQEVASTGHFGMALAAGAAYRFF